MVGSPSKILWNIVKVRPSNVEMSGAGVVGIQDGRGGVRGGWEGIFQLVL